MGNGEKAKNIQTTDELQNHIETLRKIAEKYTGVLKESLSHGKEKELGIKYE